MVCTFQESHMISGYYKTAMLQNMKWQPHKVTQVYTLLDGLFLHERKSSP